MVTGVTVFPSLLSHVPVMSMLEKLSKGVLLGQFPKGKSVTSLLRRPIIVLVTCGWESYPAPPLYTGFMEYLKLILVLKHANVPLEIVEVT